MKRNEKKNLIYLFIYFSLAYRNHKKAIIINGRHINAHTFIEDT